MKPICTKVIGFILAIAGTHAHAANLAIEPYLQVLTENSITIVWWTEIPTRQNFVHVVRPMRTTVSATSEKMLGVTLVRHLATVTDLKPNTEYEYYVAYRFRSSVSRDEPFRFVFLGDGRNDDNDVIIRHRAVYKTAMKLKPHFIVYGGDAVEYGSYSSDEKTWESFFRQVCTATQGGPPFASTIPHYFTVGNHEIYDPEHDEYVSGGLAGASMARFQAFCINPDNESKDPRWRGRYYAFTYGCATFIVLDLNNTSDDTLDNHDKIPDGCSPDWEPGSEQYLWMLEQLQRAQKQSAFTFVFAHPSPYSRGVHGTCDKAIDYQRGFELRALDPVFRRYGVDAVFTSHDHMVERCLTGPEGYWEMMDVNDPANLNYIVQGNSGHSARDPHPQWKQWMQIPDAPPETYYTVWFYDWNKASNPSTVRCSLHDVQVSNVSATDWQATFRIVSIDGLPDQMRTHEVFTSYDDVFTLQRTDPVIPDKTQEGGPDILATGNQTDSRYSNALRSVVLAALIVIAALAGFGVYYTVTRRKPKISKSA
ncbi:purple acid phosphatase family protein [Planctomycetota bacterium]